MLQRSLTPQFLVLTPIGFPGINQGERDWGLGRWASWPVLGLLGLSSRGSTIQAERYLDEHPLKQLRSLDGVRKGSLAS